MNNPYELLPLNTSVRVGSKVGKIINAELEKESTGAGLIAVHTILYTHRYLKIGYQKWGIKPLVKSITGRANYAHIELFNMSKYQRN